MAKLVAEYPNDAGAGVAVLVLGLRNDGPGFYLDTVIGRNVAAGIIVSEI